MTSKCSTLNTVDLPQTALLKERFELLELVSQDSIGSVYKALDRRDIEAGNVAFIAVKILDPRLPLHADWLKTVHGELRALQNLTHPHIVKIYDIDRDGDRHFITMEYIAGTTLARRIAQYPQGMPKEQARVLLHQIGEALNYAHQHGVIHGNLTPANIAIDHGGQVKIMNYGMASLARAGALSDPEGALARHENAYVSAALLKGLPPDPRDDWYAWTCLGYELLTGQHPYKWLDATKVQAHALPLPPRPQNLSSRHWAVWRCALASDRAQQTVTGEALRATVASATATTPSRLGMAIAAALLLTVSGALAWWHYGLRAPISDDPTHPANPVAALQPTLDLSAMEEEEDLPSSEPMPHSEVLSPSAAPAPTPEQANLTERLAAYFKEHWPLKTTPAPKPEIRAPQPEWIDLRTDKTKYALNDALTLRLKVEKPLYLTIAIVDADGKANIIFPNPYQPDNYCQPGIEYAIPPRGADFELLLEGPKGFSKIFAVASETPLALSDEDFHNEAELENLISRRRLARQVKIILVS